MLGKGRLFETKHQPILNATNRMREPLTEESRVPRVDRTHRGLLSVRSNLDKRKAGASQRVSFDSAIFIIQAPFPACSLLSRGLIPDFTTTARDVRSCASG